MKKLKKQGKNLTKLYDVVEMLSNGICLQERYRDHSLENDKYYKNCRECHIEPDWLLIYQFQEDKLTLLFVGTGSHSELF